MADRGLIPLIKKLKNSNRRARNDFLYVDRVHWQKKMRVYLDHLVNHLKKMMLGYENVEVKGMINKMEVLARGLFDSHDGFEKSWMDTILEITEELCNIRYGSNVEGEEIVGFDDDVETLLDQLTQTSIKRFQVISIVGMAGIGKTTLARKLHNDPLIEYHFDIRAWTCVSQIYVKRDLLLGILTSFIYDLTEEIHKMSDEQLGEKLYRLLKGRRYLVVLDDIWDFKAWNDLQIYFPDDKVGSRVVFTSRDIDISLHVGAARASHVLRLRTTDESWDIFQMNVFRSGICPSYLEPTGREIVRKCEGLPLAIVIASGLVKNQSSYKPSWWKQIALSLRSFMDRDPRQYMDTLSLSYNHLPPHLRWCFLFVGVFPEDYEIPVTKLIWLWIAQGFIHDQGGSRILEDVAKDFMMDLIRRSLLMIAKKRDDGQIKACRIHDLLRELCLRKAKEETFSSEVEVYRYAPVEYFSTSGTISSGLCYPFELGRVLHDGGLVLSETYKSLRILDVESIQIALFPSDVVQLVSLRYLAIQAHQGSPQESISNLVNLQMLIISSRKNVVLPKTIWNMVNLRHLYIKSGENIIEEPCFVQASTGTDDCGSGLGSLQTLSQVSPESCHNIFSKTPNLRKLGFCGPLISSLGDLEFPNTSCLQNLKELKLFNTVTYPEPTRSCNPIMFPEMLKKLTLSNIGMDWEEMWTFSLLPNLEVLKLKFNACIGERWETSDAEFARLKILKLQGLELREWECSKDNFPCLQRLVVHHCLKLKSIPLEVGRILTLELIEVQGCNVSANASALKIKEEQESEGNSFLSVHATKNVSRNLTFPAHNINTSYIRLMASLLRTDS
ncbi:putative late blight resistance protein homolog R1B-16 [Lactuca sativa]|uniref:putative late blight resistance protein homolog R1B-16 n=1 Tax=Lactuca sativa TaxID=4236 RepID=UPI000CB93C9C|nr:putative late blight resistance protein homolog R1B-16 [Lactuca sativa]XP_023755926.1 putative late blight resistance protein homolog R1B-16 [Lactuca sativa]XP_042753737.1 putative late blight resistance protein homolog R1B-16 [Lactuca sativa]XP_042753739.1 putative late blight resistance protein homolog R1B-16 [Lactuca sativa]XP_052622183.1 putative late blight resistance protein homolog R1B-16 [Lactuca sativa]XP_052622184.1 putative late blight resistance protein homolog R1B-16 [Lactuca s